MMIFVLIGKTGSGKTKIKKAMIERLKLFELKSFYNGEYFEVYGDIDETSNYVTSLDVIGFNKLKEYTDNVIPLLIHAPKNDIIGRLGHENLQIIEHDEVLYQDVDSIGYLKFNNKNGYFEDVMLGIALNVNAYIKTGREDDE